MPTIKLRDASRQEAERFFAEWVLHGEQRIAEFARRLREAGGPADALDYTPDSLVPVFAWVVDHIAFTDEVPDVDLPPWRLPGPSKILDGEFDAQSSWLVDGMCRYEAEVMVRNLPGPRWAIGDEPRRRKLYVDQNWPVLEGHLIKRNPLRTAGIISKAARLPKAERNPRWLLENFEDSREILARKDKDHHEPDWYVSETDDAGALEEGWRWGVGLHEELAHDHDDALDNLTARLRSVPGVTDVDHQEREYWMVQGTLEREDLEAAVRAWLAEQRR